MLRRGAGCSLIWKANGKPQTVVEFCEFRPLCTVRYEGRALRGRSDRGTPKFMDDSLVGELPCLHAWLGTGDHQARTAAEN